MRKLNERDMQAAVEIVKERKRHKAYEHRLGAYSDVLKRGHHKTTLKERNAARHHIENVERWYDEVREDMKQR